MQFILTEEEMAALGPKTELRKREAALVDARKAILQATSFECIHEGRRLYDRYCSECPVVLLAGESHRYICTLSKNWPK